MEADRDDLSERSETVLSRHLGPGRVGTYTLLGATTGVVPLPWIPGAMARRVRGAMVHDIATRHGLSITPEGRQILSEPMRIDGPRGLVAQGIAFAASKVLGRLGPFGFLPPVRTAVTTFVLGHLFQRYLEVLRTDRAVRIDVEEARRVRSAIDQALVYALTIETPESREPAPFLPEDLRDQPTQIVDGILIGIAGLPSWVVRRVEAAFDEVIAAKRP